MALKGNSALFSTFRSTTFVELEDSPVGAYALDRGNVTRTYLVDFAARDQAALDFAGTATRIVAPGGQTYLSRTLPHQLPSKSYMRVQSIPSVKPHAMRGTTGTLGDGTAMATYEMAEITCQYVFPTFDFLTDAEVEAEDGPLAGYADEGWHLATNGSTATRYITPSVKLATRELVLNRAILKDPRGKPILEGVPIRETTGEVTYTWHQVPRDALPRQAWIAGGGCVNEQDFDSWPAGCLLADSMPETRPSPNVIDGQVYYDLQYRFKLLILADRLDPDGSVVFRGWNYIRRLVPQLGPVVGAGRFELLLATTDGGDGTAPGTTMYPNYDFASFFRPDQP